MSTEVYSFGRLRPVRHASILDIFWRHELLLHAPRPLLAFGNGRSYGDVCLNEGGTLLRTRNLDRFISFDPGTGRLACEAGVLLKDILDFALPRGFFLPVTPGTRYVTLGGAIANDVHGKNHHVSGSFGHHVLGLELLRSTGERIFCSSTENPDLFRATIGGLGLTGLITWAEIRLMRVWNAFVEVECLRFSSVSEYFELNASSNKDWPYTVAWFDCGSKAGRGIFMRGRHAPPLSELPYWRERTRKFPFTPFFSLITPVTARIFNVLYYHRPLSAGVRLVHYVPFFYPLDSVLEWNRVYGRKGFYQYQCVLPPDSAADAIRAMLSIIARYGDNSFLGVLKNFGDQKPAGLLSFSRPGTTLALDFANRGDKTLKMFLELDSVVRDARGALNPSKDARMSKEMFEFSFPLLDHFRKWIDPGFSSSFWRRVTR